MQSRIRLLALPALVALALTAACQTAPPATPQAATPTTATPAAGATAAGTAAPKAAATAAPNVPQRLTWGSTAIGAELNPWDQGFPTGFVTRPMFDRLVNANNYDPEPMLATSWRLVNPTTWEFQLRPNVRFHNGQAMTAEDVKFSLEVAKDPQVSNATAAASTFGLLDRVDIVNPTTINIITRAPDVQMLTKLNVSPIISKAAYDQAGSAQNFKQKPIGSGPFKAVSIQPRQTAVLEANDEWWGGRPILRQITYREIPEAAVRQAGLATRELDIAADLPVDTLNQLASQNAKAVTQTFPVMVSILFDTNVAEVRDARVRLAMNYAVDRNAIIQQLTAGLAEAPAGQPLIKAMLGHNPNIQPYPFDAARARQLLADAGFPNGFTIDYPYAGFQSSFKPLAEASALYFERVGIRTNIRAVDQAVFLADLRGNTLGAIRLSAFDASSGDPGSTLQSYQSRERGGNGRWSNPRYDELFAQQAAEFDRNRRGQIIQQMMQIMNEDPPGVYFYAFVYNWGVSNRVGNFETYRSAMPLFEKMTKVSE